MIQNQANSKSISQTNWPYGDLTLVSSESPEKRDRSCHLWIGSPAHYPPSVTKGWRAPITLKGQEQALKHVTSTVKILNIGID